MNYRESARDKYYVFNNLVGLVQAIQGKQTTIDLRHGRSVTGRVDRCDSQMNVEMSHVLFRDGSGKPHIFENFFIQARNIRYVHIPPEVNMQKTLQEFYDRMYTSPPREPERRTFRQGRTMKRHAETLELIQKFKETG